VLLPVRTPDSEESLAISIVSMLIVDRSISREVAMSVRTLVSVSVTSPASSLKLATSLRRSSSSAVKLEVSMSEKNLPIEATFSSSRLAKASRILLTSSPSASSVPNSESKELRSASLASVSFSNPLLAIVATARIKISDSAVMLSPTGMSPTLSAINAR